MTFEAAKAKIVEDLLLCMGDKSPKGSVDEPIADLINHLNALGDFVTTSSCSGRVSLFYSPGESVPGKGTGTWLGVSHDRAWSAVEMEDLCSNIQDGSVVFKHEPFVMHVLCRDETSAQSLLRLAKESGFRESGLSLGAKKIIVGIRTFANMLEVPVVHEGILVANQKMFECLAAISKEKFEENARRREKLHDAINSLLEFEDPPLIIKNPQIQWEVLESDDFSVFRRRGQSATVLSDRNSILVFGGHGTGSTGCHRRLNDTAIIRWSVNGFKIQELSPSGNIPSPRVGHTSVLVANDRILLLGGRHAPNKPLNDVHILDVVRNAWVEVDVEGEFSPRYGHSCNFIGEESFMVFGGRADLVYNDVVFVSCRGNTINIGSVETHGESPCPRYAHASCSLSATQVLIHGGYVPGLDSPILGDMFLFDIPTKSWSSLSTHSCRFSHTILPYLNSKTHVLVIGGVCKDYEDNGVKLFDTESQMWSDLKSSDSYGMRKDTCFEMFQQSSIVAIGKDQKKLVAIGGGLLCFSFGFYFSPSCSADVRERKFDLNAVLVAPTDAKRIRVYLDELGYYDKTKRICKHGELMAIPIVDYELALDCLQGEQHTSFDKVEFPMAKHLLAKHEKKDSSKNEKKQEKKQEKTESLSREKPNSKMNSYKKVNPKKENLDSVCFGVIVETLNCKMIKTRLKESQLFDQRRKVIIYPLDSNKMAIPLVAGFDRNKLRAICEEAIIDELEFPYSKFSFVKGFRQHVEKPRKKQNILKDQIVEIIKKMATELNILAPSDETLNAEIPTKIEILGDVAIVPSTGFVSESIWKPFSNRIWAFIAEFTSSARVLHQHRISPGAKRQSLAKVVYPHDCVDSMVTAKQNGVLYRFDMEKCMFSSGNISEKIRVSKFSCADEVVVDLFAGIGYFTLPYLVKCNVSQLHACEWNADSLQALRHNLELNNVTQKCIVHPGDCRITAETKLCGIADRVNMGLIPSSRPFWRTGVICLKPSIGGMLHIHENVVKSNQRMFVSEMLTELKEICDSVHPQGAPWSVNCLHQETVKSYSPKVNHLVLDVKCAPGSGVLPVSPQESLFEILTVERVPYPKTLAEAQAYYDRNVPVIFETDAGNSDWSLSSLKSQSIDKLVSVHVGVSPSLDFVHKNFEYKVMQFQEMLDLAENGPPCYMRAIGFTNPRKDKADFWRDFREFSEKFPFPSNVVDKERYFSSVLRVASKNLQLWTHFDVMDNLLYQLEGSKRVVLFKPNSVESLKFVGSTSSIVDIDGDQGPEFAEARREALEVILNPGDVLYIPSLWPHNACACEFSVAVNIFWKRLSDLHYGKKDLYGNRDPLLVEKMESLVNQGMDVLHSAQDDGTPLPPYYIDFYKKRIAASLLQ